MSRSEDICTSPLPSAQVWKINSPGLGRGRPRSTTPEVQEEILEAVNMTPISTQRVALQVNVPHTTVWRLLKEYQLYPYHLQRVQALSPADYPARVRFCQWFLQQCGVNPNFPALVLFTDEAQFIRDGITNFHNQHVWAYENPCATVPSDHQVPFSLNILTGQAYTNFLENTIPHVLEDTPLINRQHIHFLHDGTPAHFSRTARQYLDRRFPDRWIGRGGPIAWPPRSSDLNPLDFYLRGYLKLLVYSSPVPDLESVRNRIVACSEDIRNTPGVWDRVRRSMRHRCEEENSQDFKPIPGPLIGSGEELDVEDLYTKYKASPYSLRTIKFRKVISKKKLQRQLEFLAVQEEYIKDEQRNLKKEYLHAQEEVKRIQSVPLVIGQFLEAVDQNTGIVGSTTGSNYYVRILSTIDRELLKPSASVALHKHSNALVDVLPPEADSSISMLQADEKPDVQYSDIGGMDMQKQEIREAVELPLTHFELYKQIGIDPPRGVLMYGPPGCGKTMLAKAVAHHTTAAFIRVVGSEFVQKYLGEGPRMVRDVFRLAKENSPAIIFIDEIDAIATKRFDAQTGADREVQRILLELLNQMDGFDQTTNVKVIMATNRADTLDPALLRPGRLDRKIEFPLPDRRQKRLVFSTITSKMNLSEEVDLEDYVARPDRISGADINAICQEAGMHAVRENRYIVLAKDFEKGYKNNIKKDESEHEFYK
ncbi:hypothetical protein ANN_03820 [Periplaneta americana]|uniref:AAA+ ATPase domain-containing protein n=2 Tax=Blattoidea TaxID=1049657 RepID=A0ABQ8U4P7_PERAM|nr:hypothetical protein ANN_03820 [Periplaneta americana]